jgi:hypothetical protein
MADVELLSGESSHEPWKIHHKNPESIGRAKIVMRNAP